MSILAPLFDDSKASCFTSIGGVTNAVFAQYTRGSHHIYGQILKIFDHFDLEYYLFAGSMVGYVRNRQMPPWMDDIDVIIFEDQIPFFEEKVVPYLKQAGFNAFKPIDYVNGGYHLLALQTGNSRRDAIAYDEGLTVTVPWAQIDVFYTSVDSAGIVRNPANWGLYHARDIPVDWVRPGKFIDFGEWNVRVFSQYEADIRKEYGDVMNNLVVSTHDKTFLKATGVPWSEVERDFRQLYETNVSQLPPSITPVSVAAYAPKADVVYEAKAGESFASLLGQCLTLGASTIRLSDPDHLFWVMDLKRILPALTLHATISGEKAAARACHLRAFIDEIVGADAATTELMQRMRDHLDLTAPAQ